MIACEVASQANTDNMQKVLLSALLIIHGLIHLIGFVSGLGIASIKGYSGRSVIALGNNAGKIMPYLWLAACVLFVFSAAGYLLGKHNWYIPAIVALVLSQLLVIVYWPDAKAGTIANVMVAVVVVFAASSVAFFRHADNETVSILHQPVKPHVLVTKDMLTHLPEPVQRWLNASGVVGKDMVHKAYLTQEGEMCIKPDGKWMPAKAEQFFNIDNPSFIWTVKVQMMPGITMTGRDKLQHAQGNMLIKLHGLFSIVDAKGEYIDQGTMLRYLGEICWFPSAALQPYISWKQIDENSAEATLSYEGKSVSAVFAFDAQGRLVATKAKRYMTLNGKSTLEEWVIPCTEWQVLHGITIPVAGSATWKLKSGDYEYYRWRITGIVYDNDLPAVNSTL